jgi:3-(3-hydroxy-phenyl)propionate hydroxylase/flavoprotein hydroxylase
MVDTSDTTGGGPVEVDVVVVGFGPTGVTLAALLGQQGYRVLALERYAEAYQLPRAAAFDDETMRTFQKLGVAEKMMPGINVQPGYVWVNGRDEVLLDIAFENPGKSGWPAQYMMYQPHVESVLQQRVREMPNVEVRHGSTVVEVHDLGDRVDVRFANAAGEAAAARAAFVVGCDGGNSFVRGAIDAQLSDLGFSENWLVCDFDLHREKTDLPAFRQVCNPAEPIAIVNIGPTHHRFSFRLQQEDRREDVVSEQRVWDRVSDYLTAADADLVRVANYTFRSCIADTWRKGRILLAGDAAHQMPPFLAQGMVSGIRDARNLAWKLDMVLQGHSDELLDSYQAEREPHVRFITGRAIELGLVQTMRDEENAKVRDETMLAARAAKREPDKLRYPPLVGGLIANDGGIFPQGLVSDAYRTALFDDVVGSGWLLVTNNRRALSGLSDADRAAFADLGGRVVSFGLSSTYGTPDVSDTGGVYGRWFAETGCVGVIVRPDSYIYGRADEPEGLADLTQALTTALRLPASV